MASTKRNSKKQQHHHRSPAHTEKKTTAAALQAASQPGQKVPFLKTPLGVASAILVICFAILFVYFGLPMFKGGSAKAGDSVSVDYVGRFENGEVFDTNIESVAKAEGLYDSSRTYEPMQFTLGSNSVIPGFDRAVAGMVVGETKTARIAPEDAYGYPQDSLIQNVTLPKFFTVPYSELQAKGINETVGAVVYTLYGEAILADLNSSFALFESRPKEGSAILFQNGISAEISSVFRASGSDELILTLDANHPLAGQALVFEVTLREITRRPAAP